MSAMLREVACRDSSAQGRIIAERLNNSCHVEAAEKVFCATCLRTVANFITTAMRLLDGGPLGGVLDGPISRVLAGRGSSRSIGPMPNTAGAHTPHSTCNRHHVELYKLLGAVHTL